MSFDAHFKAVFTGSPVVDTILDFDGTDEVRKSRYDKFKEGLATGVNNRSEPLEDWHSDCSSVNELDAQEIKESIEEGLNRKSHQKVDGQSILVDIPAPFPENPYDNYHPVNLDSLKCCSTAAFRYYIGRHIKRAVMDEVDVRIVATRVQKILAMMVLSRNLFSDNVAETRENMNLLATYNEREDRYQRELAEHVEAASWAKSAKVKDSKTSSAKIGSKFAKLSVLCTHIGFSRLDKMSTASIRTQRREGFPLLTARMKTAGALNPKDKDDPLESDEEILRQFL
ncbi:uncharacterized protein J4E88_009106 [Alternaria novae-zelandiae]|uniref:uncharacterized protein n=1 Tax=Alternaria novae-zelandiae TaxID=430562 RepID=UPI0020C50104|nr:uncharacterized protein J4E88_009106 [Alternaria novae-zelandiae]KAI4671441.1 hypothetical protein J4E88_009106 [Alternaria novae-zelandiae]